MRPQVSWAIEHRNAFIQLQKDRGIPALWAAAQHCHEAFNGEDGSMSDLLRVDNNGGGLKWAPWQEQYGCTWVEYWTWEVIKGQNVRVKAKFCHCPDLTTWLKVYGHLLTLDLYKPALEYAADPFLYGAKVWAAGYATDPAYLAKRYDDGSIGGVVIWLFELWPHFADTLPSPPWQSVNVVHPSGSVRGQLQPDGQTWAPARLIAEAMEGEVVDWIPKEKGGPQATIAKKEVPASV